MRHNSDGSDISCPGEQPSLPLLRSFDARTIGVEDSGQGEFSDSLLKLNGSQKKTEFALRLNVEAMLAGAFDGLVNRELEDVEHDGRKRKVWRAKGAKNLNSAGFLTLTVGNHECPHSSCAKGVRQWSDVGNDWKDGERPCCCFCGAPLVFVQVYEQKEASRRFNNLNRRVIPKHFRQGVVVPERHKNKAIHFHGIMLLREPHDIRSGFNFAAFDKAREARKQGWVNKGAEIAYKRAACPALREIWAELRAVLPRYGFGRAELTPIKKTGEAVSAYIAKYVRKNLYARDKVNDKGARLVRYVGDGWKLVDLETGERGKRGAHLKANDFSWEASGPWRRKCRDMAGMVGITDRDEMKHVFGPRWAYYFSRLIAALPQEPVSFWPWEIRQLAKLEVVKIAPMACRRIERNIENWRKHRATFEAAPVSGDLCEFVADDYTPEKPRFRRRSQFESPDCVEGRLVEWVRRIPKAECGANGFAWVKFRGNEPVVIPSEWV